jgi:hypothetical protein
MIMRTKTPKGPSWAGRIAVLGVAALTLPLAPSRAQKSETEQPTLERRESLRKRAEAVGSDDRQTRALKQQVAIENLAHIRKELLEVQSQKRKAQALLKAQKQVEPTEAEINQSIDQDPVIAGLSDKLAEYEEQLNAESSRSRALARSGAKDPALAALKQRIGASRKSLASKRAALRPNAIKQLQDQNKSNAIKQELAMLDDLERGLTQEIKTLSNENRSLAVNTLEPKRIQDGDKKQDDDDKTEKARDAAERFQEQLQDLISKLGKELSPVTGSSQSAGAGGGRDPPVARKGGPVGRGLRQGAGEVPRGTAQGFRRRWGGRQGTARGNRPRSQRYAGCVRSHERRRSGSSGVLAPAIAHVEGSGPREFRSREGRSRETPESRR